MSFFWLKSCASPPANCKNWYLAGLLCVLSSGAFTPWRENGSRIQAVLTQRTPGGSMSLCEHFYVLRSYITAYYEQLQVTSFTQPYLQVLVFVDVLMCSGNWWWLLEVLTLSASKVLSCTWLGSISSNMFWSLWECQAFTNYSVMIL